MAVIVRDDRFVFDEDPGRVSVSFPQGAGREGRPGESAVDQARRLLEEDKGMVHTYTPPNLSPATIGAAPVVRPGAETIRPPRSTSKLKQGFNDLPEEVRDAIDYLESMRGQSGRYSSQGVQDAADFLRQYRDRLVRLDNANADVLYGKRGAYGSSDRPQEQQNDWIKDMIGRVLHQI